VVFDLGEPAFASAVAEHHVLKFTFAALVADGAVERVVGQQKFERRLARLGHLWTVGQHSHAFSRQQRARRL